MTPTSNKIEKEIDLIFSELAANKKTNVEIKLWWYINRITLPVKKFILHNQLNK